MHALRQALCRLVDRVTVKGSITPMELYTYDVPLATVNGTSVVSEHAYTDPNVSCPDFFAAVQPAVTERFRAVFGMVCICVQVHAQLYACMHASVCMRARMSCPGLLVILVTWSLTCRSCKYRSRQKRCPRMHIYMRFFTDTHIHTFNTNQICRRWRTIWEVKTGLRQIGYARLRSSPTAWPWNLPTDLVPQLLTTSKAWHQLTARAPRIGKALGPSNPSEALVSSWFRQPCSK
jgi:hypothetical protein